MAIIPNAPNQVRGVIGTWANMEEDNARSMFAESEFASAVPLTYGTKEMSAKPLEADSRFIGIALRNHQMHGKATSDGDTTYSVGSLFGMADMGAVFVLAGEDVTEGADVFYDTATRKYHGATATGRLKLPGCEFDEASTDGEPVALRIRILPGAANVTAES